MNRFAARILLLLLLVAGPVPAAEKSQNAQPIDIAADRLEADDAAGQVKFLGQVVATQGDMTLYAQRMTLFLQAKTREIERVEAFGDVRIVQGDRVATGQKGVFHRFEGRIVLTGDPQVRQGDDFVRGDEIVVFVDEQKSIVRSGNNARVKATFHPKEKAR